MVTLASGVNGEPAVFHVMPVRAWGVEDVITQLPKMGDAFAKVLQRNPKRAWMFPVPPHHLDQVTISTYFEFIKPI